MNLTMMRTKIHRATVTEADLNYEGSISICPDLLKASGLLLNEQVDIYNCHNGARFTTYVIAGRKGEICLNGAAARHVQKGDLVIIVAYCSLAFQEAQKHVAKAVFVDEKNRIKQNRLENHRNNKKK